MCVFPDSTTAHVGRIKNWIPIVKTINLSVFYQSHKWNLRALDRVFLVGPKSDMKVKGDVTFADNLQKKAGLLRKSLNLYL